MVSTAESRHHISSFSIQYSVFIIMFYQSNEKLVRAAVVLTPEGSKKLIARAVPKIPEVAAALNKGIVVIAGGTTNGYIAREITGEDIDVHRYTAGRIYQGRLDATPKEERITPIVLVDGKSSGWTIRQALEKFTSDDVFIKGANAVDPMGNAGVLAANPEGGTVGAFWAVVCARGGNIICPVGLEKLIPSVETACVEAGQGRFKYAQGHKVGLLPLPGAKVVTEIQALKVLYDVEAVHIASGGIMGSEGSVVLSVKGTDEQIEAVWKEISN